MRKLSSCTQNKPIHIILFMYLTFCVSYTSSVICIKYSIVTKLLLVKYITAQM